MGRIMGNEQPAMTTDGRRHPGIFKQVGQLVAASEAAPDLAYMGRQLTLCCLPRTNPGDKSQYLRQNGLTSWAWPQDPAISCPTVRCRASCLCGCAPKPHRPKAAF